LDEIVDVPVDDVLLDELVDDVLLDVLVDELEHPGAPPINLRFEKTNG